MHDQTMRFIRPALFLSILSILPLGCSSATPPPSTAPIVQPTANEQQFEYAPAGISFLYPANWKMVSTDPVQFKFVQTNQPDSVQLTLDIPKLPWHPPGWIPIDRVRDGYIDDEKKHMTAAQVSQQPDPTLSDARQHRVMMTGIINGKPSTNDAVMIVHNDRVYILSVETDTPSYPPLKKALDEILASLKWLK